MRRSRDSDNDDEEEEEDTDEEEPLRDVEIVRLQAVADELGAQLAEARARAERAEERRRAAQDDADAAQRLCDTLRGQMRELTERVRAGRAELEAEVRALGDRACHAEEELAAERARSTRIARDLSDAARTIAELRAREGDCSRQQQRTPASEGSDDNDAAVALAAAKAEEARGRAELLAADKAFLERSLDEAAAKAARAEAVAMHKRESCRQLRAALDAAVAERDRAKAAVLAEASAVQEHLRSVHREELARQREDAKAAAASTVAAMREARDVADAECRRLREEVAVLHAAVSAAEARAVGAEAELRSRDAEIDGHLSLLAHAEADAAMLRKRVDEAERMLLSERCLLPGAAATTPTPPTPPKVPSPKQQQQHQRCRTGGVIELESPSEAQSPQWFQRLQRLKRQQQQQL